MNVSLDGNSMGERIVLAIAVLSICAEMLSDNSCNSQPTIGGRGVPGDVRAADGDGEAVGVVRVRMRGGVVARARRRVIGEGAWINGRSSRLDCNAARFESGVPGWQAPPVEVRVRVPTRIHLGGGT